MGDELLTIGQAATRFGLASSTLRWWERQGLLEPAQRQAGQRYYGRAELRRIAVICLARDTGLLRLDQIATLLAGRTADRHWHDTVRDRTRELDRQIEQLTAARRWLDHALGCQADNPTQCSHLDPYLDQKLATGQDNPPAALSAPGPAHARNRFRHEFRHEHRHHDRTGAPAPPQARCKVCALPVPQAPTGRPRAYCSRACRQRAYRARAAARSRAR